jgi:predicted nucleic acid-binding protein
MVVGMTRIAIADTNVVSYFLKKNDPLSFEYERLLSSYSVHIAFMTVAELNAWAEKNGWGARGRLQLWHILSSLPVLPCSKNVAEVVDRVRDQRKRAGRPMSAADAWIAATAIYFDAPLATHDGNFVETPGLRVISANPEVCL